MADISHIEYYVIGENGKAFAWEDDYSAALSHCNPDAKKSATRIEKVTHYLDDRETVWER